jgi:hypothetical protein
MCYAGVSNMIKPTSIQNFVHERAIRARMAWYQAIEPDYASAYRRLMAHCVHTHGADQVVGAHDFGQRQFQFLVDRVGIKPDERFVEIGCGSLCAGEYFISYLAPKATLGWPSRLTL